MPSRNENRSHLDARTPKTAQNRLGLIGVDFGYPPIKKPGSRLRRARIGLRGHFVHLAVYRACGYWRAGQSERAGLLRAGLRDRIVSSGRALAGLRIDQAGLLVPIAGGLAGFHRRACWRVQGLTDGGLAG